MHAVIFSGGKLRTGRFTDQALADADLIIGADSGARSALEFGITPAVVIGDLDSLDQASRLQLEQTGSQFMTHQADKDQTDTELALAYAVEQQADRITILGGSDGDRLDHILANVFLLGQTTVPTRLANGAMLLWLAKGPATIDVHGVAGDLLSLLPVTPTVSKVTTEQLRYSLNQETLYQHQSRGVSNQLTEPQATVSFGSGRLLFFQTAAARD